MSLLDASVVVATYNMPHHLALVLAGLGRQSASNFEVLICDDGSGSETKAVIQAFQQKIPFPIRHFWQEHQGFRKCRILNQAVREASGRVMIFLDGDCVPHRDFVRDHLAQQQPGYYLAGRRVELGEEISRLLTPEKVRDGFFDFPKLALIKSAWQGETQALQRSVRVPWDWMRKLLKMNRVADLKGCNYSVPKEVIEAINGFDEAYEGYGREDTDVEIRLQNLGLKIKSLKGLALQFHVWHPRRDFTPANEDLLEEVKRTRRVRCVRGLAGPGEPSPAN
ncbi:glycosyltransferase family 2 protein [bacterium]|jgi:glycosyltransferase involved in cell wall biosynthesis|nr:glycosyltransferase family 2 protein [bacterium]